MHPLDQERAYWATGAISGPLIWDRITFGQDNVEGYSGGFVTSVFGETLGPSVCHDGCSYGEIIQECFLGQLHGHTFQRGKRRHG